MANPGEPMADIINNMFRIPNSRYTNENDNFEVWTPAPIKVDVVQQASILFPEIPKQATNFVNAHSCSWCDKVIVDPRVDFGRSDVPIERRWASFSVRWEYSITDIYNASFEGCLFFRSLFGHGGSHVVDPRQRNLATIDDPLERYIAKWGQGRFVMSFRTKKGNFDDVHDVHSMWIHRTVPGVDERYSCRVPRPSPSHLAVCALQGMVLLVSTNHHAKLSKGAKQLSG
jgi:hypothetical protein